MAHFLLTVEVLSPVHIGDGTELVRDLDFVTRKNSTWIIDQDALLERVLGADDSFDDRLLERPPSELVMDADFEDEGVFRYIMRGTPEKGRLRSHIKDVYGHPYLPGSTLKGLLRTVFIWGLYAVRGETPNLDNLRRSRSWAGQSVERQVMGRNPNEDLFRAVQVSDSEPTGLDALRVRSVDVYPTGGVIVDVEALREGTVLTASLNIDEYGFKQAANELHWQGKRELLDYIVPFGKAFSEQRLNGEWSYFRGRSNASRILGFYNGPMREAVSGLEDNQFLAQIGWGTGWNSKTLNNLLTTDAQQFTKLVRDYRLTRFHRDFRPGQTFPASRHLVRQNEQPVRPLGWARITIEEL